MSSDFKKVEKRLEWCTHLPSKDHPRESPTFFLKGNEFLIQLIYEFPIDRWYCDFFLKLKNKYEDLEPDEILFEIGFKYEESLSLQKKKFKVSESCEFWYIEVSKLRSKLPEDYLMGNWIKVLFHFDNIDEPLLNIGKNIDEKFITTRFMLESVSIDFAKLLEEGQNHDVEFICEDGKVKAHKDILCCRSSVFASMLQSDMMEGNTGQVNIQDMNIAIFRQFLRCLYTAQLPELTVNTAVQFYEIADKYDVGSFRKHCTNYITGNLSLENAFKMLIVADRHSDNVFKMSIIEYMLKEKIPLKSDIWIEFCKENAILANEVLNLFCQRTMPNV